MHRTPLDRRTFLRASGIAVALPFLESMTRAFGAPSPSAPQRIVAIGTPFGFDPYVFVPGRAGRDYELTPHLEHLKEHRDDFTVCSGLSHPNTGGGGHKAEAVLLTGAPYPDYSYNLRNTISLDQAFAAAHRGRTRFDSLVLTTYGGSLSYTGNGVNIPALDRPSQIFSQLFLAGTPQQQAEELRRIGAGRSLLDFVGDQARRLDKRVAAPDRARLDEYFESVRDVERQLQMSGEWVNRPKPKAPGPPPKDVPGPATAEQQAKLKLMFDMILLAVQTDSTRAITIKTFGGHHDLSHHGKDPKKRGDCQAVEVELLAAFADLLAKLKTSREAGGTRLLDNTMVLLTSNLRDGNSHWTYDLPVILAGGGFAHGRHLAFNPPLLAALADGEGAGKVQEVPAMGREQQPLCNLYLSMLQRGGVETDRFGSSTGTLAGLD